MRLDTITLEDLRVTIDHLIELHGLKKEVTDFNITLKSEDLKIPESSSLSMIEESFFGIHEK